MQKRLVTVCLGALLLMTGIAIGQTNTFPSSGNVGIGTTNPIAALDVVGTQTNQNPTGGEYLLNFSLGGSREDPNNGDIILLVPASTGTPVNGSQFIGVIESNRGGAGAWNLNSEWYVSVQSAYTSNTGSILPLSGQQEYASIPTLITCTYNGTTYIGFQTPSGNSLSVWSMTGNWSNGQNDQKPIMVASSAVSNISTLVGFESLGSQISMTGIGNNARVGIGTTNPGQMLQVGSSYSQNPAIMIGGHDSDNSSNGVYSLLFGAWRDVETSVTSGIVATPVWTCCDGYPASGYPGIRLNTLGFYAAYDPANPTNFTPNMLIDYSGNIGIGTQSPTAKLDVNGNINIGGSINLSSSGAGITFPNGGGTQTTAWTGVLCGGDYAEAVNVNGTRESYEPGDVMVLGSDGNGEVQKAMEAYATTVAGIYATKPGIIGKRQSIAADSTDIPMAMIGIVPTKVSTENGPIRRGDLLVTSSTPGYAMKGTDRSRMLGAIIGKAVGSIESGTGVIEVLVTLQ